MVWTTIITFVIIAVFAAFLLYLFFGPNGIFWGATDQDVTRFVPGMPQDIPRGVAVEASQGVREWFNEFVDILPINILF